MFCKSGILIFIFAENNYSIYAHIMLIKTPLLYQSFGPVSCFLSLSLFFRLIPWSTEVLCAHFPAGLLRPSQKGALHLHLIERAPEAFMNRACPVQGLYWLYA